MDGWKKDRKRNPGQSRGTDGWVCLKSFTVLIYPCRWMSMLFTCSNHCTVKGHFLHMMWPKLYQQPFCDRTPSIHAEGIQRYSALLGVLQNEMAVVQVKTFSGWQFYASVDQWHWPNTIRFVIHCAFHQEMVRGEGWWCGSCTQQSMQVEPKNALSLLPRSQLTQANVCHVTKCISCK